MKKAKLVCTAIMSLLLIFTFLSPNVLAYVLNTDGYYQSTIPINLSNVSSYYKTAMNNAITSWNNCGTPCTVTTSNSSNNMVYPVVDLPSTAWGMYGVQARNSDPNHCTTQFVIALNANLFPSATSNQRQSTCVHELGHAMGLADIVSGTAIMNINRNRSVIYSPTGDDVRGVEVSW